MRVALYVRVSTQRQAQAQTVEQQVERLAGHARQQGWDVPPDQIVRDDGYSGASLRRPGLGRLRDRAAARSLDLILITAPDRLARNYVHQVLLLEELQGHGCEVRFLDRPMSQDPHDQLLLQIRGAVAEYERTLITERMRRGRQRKLEAGLMLPWTRPPFGYRVDPDRPRDPAGVRVEEAEAAVVREMFAWYAEEAHSFCSLARLLERRGIRTSTGLKRWNLASIRALLTNPAYAGQVYGNRWHRRGTLERRSATAPARHSAMSRVDAPREGWTRPGRSGSWWPRSRPWSAGSSSIACRHGWSATAASRGATTRPTPTCCATWSAAGSAAWPAWPGPRAGSATTRAPASCPPCSRTGSGSVRRG
jgi:DNA invertase Pin-like site-specific DNA recombinase